MSRFPFSVFTCFLVVTLFASCSRNETAANEAAVRPESSTTRPPPAKIAHGATVDIMSHLVPGKITIFDFTSQYCPPCQRISPLLDALHARRDDLAVVKVDINRPDVKGIDWQSPVAQQYALQSVPHFKVFGADGKLMAEGDAGAEMVFGWLEQK